MPKVLWCGPAVLCTLTGAPLSWVEAVLMDMGVDPAATRMEDIERAFRRLAGMTVEAVEWWDDPRSSPRLIDWLESRPWRWRLRHPLAIDVQGVTHDRDAAAPVTPVNGEEIGHFVAVWGDHILDSLSLGRWEPLATSRRRFRRISAVWRVEPPPSAAGPVAMR
jgi:hypothetical protein